MGKCNQLTSLPFKGLTELYIRVSVKKYSTFYRKTFNKRPAFICTTTSKHSAFIRDLTFIRSFTVDHAMFDRASTWQYVNVEDADNVEQSRDIAIVSLVGRHN